MRNEQSFNQAAQKDEQEIIEAQRVRQYNEVKKDKATLMTVTYAALMQHATGFKDSPGKGVDLSKPIMPGLNIQL